MVSFNLQRKPKNALTNCCLTYTVIMLYFFSVYQTSDNMKYDKQHWCALIPEIFPPLSRFTYATLPNDCGHCNPDTFSALNKCCRGTVHPIKSENEELNFGCITPTCEISQLWGVGKGGGQEGRDTFMQCQKTQAWSNLECQHESWFRDLQNDPGVCAIFLSWHIKTAHGATPAAANWARTVKWGIFPITYTLY